MDYFDAVEFRSGKVEGILNDYKNEKNLENLRLLQEQIAMCGKYTLSKIEKINRI